MRTSRKRLGMEKIIEILRLYELGVSQSEISRSTNVSRPTVRDYVRKARAAGLSSEDVKGLSEEALEELFKKGRSGRKEVYREPNYELIRIELLRKGVTRQLLWEEYLRDNPGGMSYTQFCDRYRAWSKGKDLRLRREHKAGERLEVDYAGMTVPIYDRETGGVVFEASIFVGVLCATNYTYAEAVSGQELRSWLGSHVRLFEYLGGVPEVVVPDNLKSGVNSPCRYEPEINRSYQELAEHYGVAVIPARVKKPRDKGKVENAVQQAERRLLAPLRHQRFYSLEELNVALSARLTLLNTRTMRSYGKSRQELFDELEKPALKPLPVKRYQYSEWKQAKVNIDYHVEVKRHYYSVPYNLVGSYVDVRVSDRTVEIFCQRKRVAVHQRNLTAGRHTTDKAHLPAEHRYMMDWNPARFLDWADKIGPQTQLQINSLLLSRRHPEQAYRACLGLLSLAKKFGSARLENACAKANELGIVSMPRIKSMLQTKSEQIKQGAQRTVIVSHQNIRGDTEFH